VQELASGDYFGEMALLLDQPRNATVRAREDSELLALRRPAFVELVRDHPQLRAHFNEMMRARGAIVTPDGDVQLTTPPEIVLPTERRPFWIALALGLGLFFALSDATRVSSAPALAFLTLIVGALVGPVSYVVYLASTNVLTWQPRRIAITFAIAALAVPLTARIEFAIGTLGTGLPGALTAAAVEEPAKVLIIVWLLRRPEMRFQMDGVIFGAAAGMGFSAFESLNYGFLNMSSMSLMLGILWFRAMLSPFTHGTWTAIICAVIWRVKGTGLPRWDWRVLAAFAVSIGLHVAWDWAPVRFPLQYYYMGVGVVGLAILGLLVRGARRQQGSAVVALNPELLSRARISQHAPVACLRCGQMAPSGAHFCPRCGVALRL
jgi:RsiW-degrading membrane proteinase PrsW (M82 family)